MTYIIISVPPTKLDGQDLSRLHSADDDAVQWLENLGIRRNKNCIVFLVPSQNIPTLQLVFPSPVECLIFIRQHIQLLNLLAILFC